MKHELISSNCDRHLCDYCNLTDCIHHCHCLGSETSFNKTKTPRELFDSWK